MPTLHKKLPHINLFVGPDSFSRAEKIASWKKRFVEKHAAGAIHIFDCETEGENPEAIQTLKNACAGPTLFSATSLVIIKNPFSKKADAVRELLCSLLPSCSAETFVVLSDDARDARSEFSKLLTQLAKKDVCAIEEFIVPTGSELKNWITTRAEHYGGTFEPRALTVFLESGADVSLWQCDREIRKLVSYASARAITVEDIGRCACLPVTGHVFDMSDALIAGNTATALQHAHRVLGPYRTAIQGPLLKMLAFLLTQFRSFLMLKSMSDDGKTEAHASDILSWNPKRVWVVQNKLARRSLATLKNDYSGLLNLERAIKTGTGDPLLALDLWITRTASRKTKSS